MSLSVFLLVQMQYYLEVPGGKTWNQVSKVIKKDWKKGDSLSFSPSWLSGYAMSRKRYLNVIRPDQLIKKSQIQTQKRIWVVEAWGDEDGPRLPPGYREISLRQFGVVWVVLIEK